MCAGGDGGRVRARARTHCYSATTIEVVGSSVLRTPRREWTYCGNSPPDGPYWQLSLNSLNMSVRLMSRHDYGLMCVLRSFDSEIPWLIDMSWFTDVLKAAG